MIVQRRGGTISLKRVEEAIKKLQIGTDRTAAELAIPRYEKDLKDLKNKNVELQEACEAADRHLGLGGLVVVVGLISVYWSWSGGLSLLAIGSFVVWVFMDASKDHHNKTKGMQDRIRQLEAAIAEKKRIADG